MKITAKDTIVISPAERPVEVRRAQEAKFDRSVGHAIRRFAPDVFRILEEESDGEEFGTMDRHLIAEFFVLTKGDRELILSFIANDETRAIAEIIFAASRDAALQQVTLKPVDELTFDEALDGVPING